MEGLKKLEQIQTTLMFMESHALISSSTPSPSPSDSHRFLANFLLFLMEPCGTLTFDHKCRLISQHLPQISAPSFFEKAMEVLPEKGSCPVNESDFPLLDQVDMNTADKLGMISTHQDMALIGLDAVQRANSTLEDFCRSYFMFHGIDANRPENIFKYFPVLSFTESYIYQLDSLNEKMVNECRSTATSMNERSGEEADSNWASNFMRTFEPDPFKPLTLLLDQHGLLTERIREELRYGEEYWALERKLCSALEEGLEILVEDVMRSIHLKSFDYRVLNLLLYQLRGEKVNDLHMEFLSVSEFLVEISDDLYVSEDQLMVVQFLCFRFDYEEDVLENNFNILRMFVRIYGTSAAPAMLAKCIAEAEEEYEELSKALDSELSLRYRRRCEEATKEGGKISGQPLGSWTIPPIIVDEELYRSSLQSS